MQSKAESDWKAIKYEKILSLINEMVMAVHFGTTCSMFIFVHFAFMADVSRKGFFLFYGGMCGLLF